MKSVAFALLASVLLLGCVASPKATVQTNNYAGKTLIQTDSVVGAWRAYSSYVGFARGGHTVTDLPGGEILQIKDDGTWDYGSSHGSWSVNDIAGDDWTKWKVPSYGPVKKIVLDGWNNGSADGPIEESNSRVNFIWVIYNAAPPVVSEAEQIQLKFGH